uniref:LisH domain-containing protein n=1 Tax=Elaeophora elaphi TaxID=1147741 RepID=A0A0R3RPE6_9BILA
MDSDISDLKQAIIDKLRLNGTLDRIQAELRCAIFLAIESNDDNGLEVDKSRLDQRLGYSIIYHFLRQNRFLATAAVFEKEIHQEIISLEELKKENVATFYFQFFGDSINFSNFILTETERRMNESYSTKIGNNEMNYIDSNLISSLGENRKNDVEDIEKQQTVNIKSNGTLKSLMSDSQLSNDQNGGLERSGRRAGKEIQNGQSLEKSSSDDKAEKYDKGSRSSSTSTIFEQQQQQQTPSTSSSTTSRHQQQSARRTIPLSSTYPRKLPPIKPKSNEALLSTKLPSIPSLNNSSNRPGTETVPFSRMLDTILNSPSSSKSETGEDIAEEFIVDGLLQSDNNSSTTISF